MRPKKLIDAQLVLTYALKLPLADRVLIVRELKSSIEAEVKQKQEAAKEAEQIANGK